MRSDWAKPAQLNHVLAALMPQNRLVMRVCIATALRLGDVLNLRTDALKQRITVREMKTGKTRRIYLPLELYHALVGNAGKIWVFEGRLDATKHRTRQAVYNDVKHAAAVFKRTGTIERGRQISPHTGRKNAAVESYAKSGDIGKTARLLNHSDTATTMIYAMADVATARKLGGDTHDER